MRHEYRGFKVNIAFCCQPLSSSGSMFQRPGVSHLHTRRGGGSGVLARVDVQRVFEGRST